MHCILYISLSYLIMNFQESLLFSCWFNGNIIYCLFFSLLVQWWWCCCLTTQHCTHTQIAVAALTHLNHLYTHESYCDGMRWKTEAAACDVWNPTQSKRFTDIVLTSRLTKCKRIHNRINSAHYWEYNKMRRERSNKRTPTSNWISLPERKKIILWIRMEVCNLMCAIHREL